MTNQPLQSAYPVTLTWRLWSAGMPLLYVAALLTTQFPTAQSESRPSWTPR